MVEIVYNGIVFEILIMEIKPEGSGISLLDIDLEVSKYGAKPLWAHSYT